MTNEHVQRVKQCRVHVTHGELNRYSTAQSYDQAVMRRGMSLLLQAVHASHQSDTDGNNNADEPLMKQCSNQVTEA